MQLPIQPLTSVAALPQFVSGTRRRGAVDLRAALILCRHAASSNPAEDRRAAPL